MTIEKILVEHCQNKGNIVCPTSFVEYNGKEYVNLKLFWTLLNELGIKTYKDGKKWYEVAEEYISEKNLKQKLTYFCRYGTLNCPRGFKQILDYVSNGKLVEVMPLDNKFRVSSLDFNFEDVLNYDISIDGKKVEVLEDEYEKITKLIDNKKLGTNEPVQKRETNWTEDEFERFCKRIQEENKNKKLNNKKSKRKIDTNWMYTENVCQSLMFLDETTFIPGEWCEDCNCKCQFK